jgi:hypothetical protein
MRDAHLYSPQEEKIKESVNLDNIPLTPVDIEKLKEMRK